MYISSAKIFNFKFTEKIFSSSVCHLSSNVRIRIPVFRTSKFSVRHTTHYTLLLDLLCLRINSYILFIISTSTFSFLNVSSFLAIIAIKRLYRPKRETMLIDC